MFTALIVNIAVNAFLPEVLCDPLISFGGKELHLRR